LMLTSLWSASSTTFVTETSEMDFVSSSMFASNWLF
jgi:hypothetical protein